MTTHNDVRVEGNPEICGCCGKEIPNGIGLFICADCAAERMWKKRKGMNLTVKKVCEGIENDRERGGVRNDERKN